MDELKLKEAVRTLRKMEENSTIKVDGEDATRIITSTGELLKVGSTTWKVQGTERLRLFEIKKPKPQTPEARGNAHDTEETCESCGKPFIKSKFNPYFTKCPNCRRKEKGPPPQGREFTCPECGKPFVVSKFQPYLNPERCPPCARKKAQREYLERKKAIG